MAFCCILHRVDTDKILSTIELEITRLQQARAILTETNGDRPGFKAVATTRPKRKLSAAARERIAAAQRKRWAAFKKNTK